VSSCTRYIIIKNNFFVDHSYPTFQYRKYNCFCLSISSCVIYYQRHRQRHRLQFVVCRIVRACNIIIISHSKGFTMRTDTILSISRGSVECTFKPIRVRPRFCVWTMKCGLVGSLPVIQKIKPDLQVWQNLKRSANRIGTCCSFFFAPETVVLTRCPLFFVFVSVSSLATIAMGTSSFIGITTWSCPGCGE